jgi:hypothetical protein
MIHLYGDSHVRFCFNNFLVPHINHSEDGVTMHRVGRDNTIINFDSIKHDYNSILCFEYGEIDCRCQISKQIELGRDEDEIIYTLVTKYMNTISNNVKIYKKIVIVAVIPPTNYAEAIIMHGYANHNYPITGDNQTIIRYTNKVNQMLELISNTFGYIYFDPYDYYKNADGSLNGEFTHDYVHILYNVHFLTEFCNKCL